MNIFDWVLIGIFAVSAIWGYKTGLVTATLNAASLYISLLLSGLFAGNVLSLIWDGIDSAAISTAIGYVIIFVAVFLISRIVAAIIKKALNLTFTTWIDSLGGVLIGIVAGILISGGVMTVLARYAFVETTTSVEAEIELDNLITDGIEGFTDKITGRTIAYAQNLGRENTRRWLIRSQIVPSLLNLRTFVISFAPEEFGISIDRLEQAIHQNN